MKTITTDRQYRRGNIQANFEHIFEYLLDEYENNVQIMDFMQRLERDFMMRHEPDYEYWKQKRIREAREQRKNRRSGLSIKPFLKLVSSRPLHHR